MREWIDEQLDTEAKIFSKQLYYHELQCNKADLGRF